MTETILREMTPNDHETVHALWRRTDGVGLSEADTWENIAAFLHRNPGFSHVALTGGVLSGVILCGHDGRRGYIHHLAVDSRRRRRGIGSRLVTAALSALKRAGIGKCHLFVFADNREGIAFWENIHWKLRRDLVMMSHRLP